MKQAKNPFIKLLYLFIISITLSGCGDNPDKTANHFMSLLIDGKHLEVQEMLSKDMKSLVGFVGGITNNTLNPYYRSGVFKSYTLTPIEKTDNAIRYKVSAVTNNGKTYEDFMDIIQEDGEWKISKF